ncbi:MAG TPA: LPXTG cell wall anchor domain-containing protein [Candidatus Saccharicenans sp.]|nr:LPXTG cell wall anchor domain-containing protein [Candidatus Saccharicenans sp.]HUM78482.1 LPXTG cell wall anchor domain-containing protein [Candidatus Saccharicenans sp.]
MKKSLVIVACLLLLVWLTTAVAYAWSDDAGPGWRPKGGEHKIKPHHPQSVAEPLSIALIGIGLAGLGIYASKKRKKN